MIQDLDKKIAPVLKNLTEEEKKEVLVQAADSLAKRLIVRVYDHLVESDQVAFDEISETGDPEKIEEFLKLKVPNLESIRDEELDILLQEMREFIGGGEE
jgi:hypothetical protein